jgi:DNA-binding NtrC family response regulator
MITVLDDLTNAKTFDVHDERPTRSDAPRRWATSNPHVLLAEDDAAMRRLLAQAMRQAGFEVQEAEDGLHTLTVLESWSEDEGLRPHLVVSDIRMPGADGLRILSALRRSAPRVPVILITAFGYAETHVEAFRRGAHAVLDKPFAIADLINAMHKALDDRRAHDACSGDNLT